MPSVNVEGHTYSVEDRRDGERAVTCRRGIGGQLLTSVVLPPEAIPVIGEALFTPPAPAESDDIEAKAAWADRVVTLVDELAGEETDGQPILEIIEAALKVDIDAVKVEARQAAISDLQAEHDAVVAKLHADNAAAVAKLNADLEQVRAELAARSADPKTADVVPIAKARAAKDSKPAKWTTRRRPAPAKK